MRDFLRRRSLSLTTVVLVLLLIAVLQSTISIITLTAIAGGAINVLVGGA